MFILKYVLGRDIRFLQSLTFDEARPLKFLIDVGSFVIAVPSKWSVVTCSMFYPNSGIVFKLEHSERIRISRDSISNFLGRLLRFLQPFRLRRVSFLWTPIDGCISRKFIQSSRTNFSRIGILAKSGVSNNFRDPFNSMNFNISQDCKNPKRHKKKNLASKNLIV